MFPPNGFPIVLTADRTLVASYRLLFDGMLAASQTTTTPRPVMDRLLMPRVRSRDGRTPVAPLGLRRIEAALLAGGFAPEQVAVVAPDDATRAIGPETRVIGVATGEPVGRGMNSNTMTAIAGGRIYPEAMFRRLMADVGRVVAARAPAAQVLVGGPGAWQLAADTDARRALGVHHVVVGYAEGNAAGLFHALADGDALPEVIAGQPVEAAAIPPIRAASTMGVVEISRGCGLGCGFCTIGRTPMCHLTPETILADIETNVAAGLTSAAVLSEDFFRYGAKGMRANPPALLGLLEQARRVKGLRLLQADHANVVTVAQYADEELRAARELLAGTTGCEYPWVNLGIETASGELLKANGGTAKLGGHAPAAWGDLCAEQVRRLCRAGFFPLLSLVIGLPGEREEDTRCTLAWVRDLRRERLAVFPMLLAPIHGGDAPRARDLGRTQWDLIKACYGLNFRWVPRMYRDNQAAAGVPAAKRLMLQALGYGQVAEWKALFAWHSRHTG